MCRSWFGTLSASAPLRTITGVAALRRPRGASTCPWPIQTMRRASPRTVMTASPGLRSSMATSPVGVRIRVPRAKQVDSPTTSRVSLLPFGSTAYWFSPKASLSPHFSPNQVHWGGDSERIVLQPRFFLNPQDAPMLTECSPALFDFLPVEGRQVVASFDGGAITSDAGALLLGQTDRALRLTERFASCFADTRTAELVEHQVETMVMQRVVGIALGYEDLNDHDELRRDPVLAVLAGKLEAQRSDCAPLAGKSTLNRLELSRAEPTRYHKVSHDPAAIESLFVDLFLDAHKKAPKQIILDLDATDDPLHGNQEGKFFHGYGACPRAGEAGPGGLLLLPAALHLLRPTLAGRQAAPLEPRCRGRRRGGSRPYRGANSPPLAQNPHSAARRFRLHPRGPDGVVRGEPRGLRVRPGPQRAAGEGDHPGAHHGDDRKH